MARLLLVAPSVALLAVLLLAGPALAALRIGTDGNETLVGTTGNDQINGKGGDDMLKGKAGNDVYFFANSWGFNDLVVEKAGEGIDTVNFRGVTGSDVTVRLIPEWVANNVLNNGATGPSGGVLFRYTVNGAVMQSIVENAIGGQADGDGITGGSAKNILQPGGGATDHLWDYGGYNDGPEGQPNLQASNDVYKGFAGNTGTDFIGDWGGSGDVLDLRPFALGDIYIDKIDADNDFDGSGSQESLQIVTSPTTQIVVRGHFGPYENLAAVNFQGRIETIRLADETFTNMSSLQQVTAAASEATSGKQAKLAAAAEGLAKEARELASKAPKPGPLPGDGGKADKHQAETGTQQHDKSAKHANKDKRENQPKREKTQNTHQKHHQRR